MGNRLTSSQTQLVSDVLKKYGIDSPVLRAELTDHFAESIELQMREGIDFDVAFEKFKADNSWLKLRKLQHQHEELHATSFLRYFRGFLREMFVGRRLWVTYPTFFLIYLIFSEPSVSSEAFICLLQFTSIATAIFMMVRIATSTRRKLWDFKKVINLTAIQLYLGLYLPIVGLTSFGHPPFQGFRFATEVNVIFHGLWIFSLIFTIEAYLRSEKFRRNFLRTLAR